MESEFTRFYSPWLVPLIRILQMGRIDLRIQVPGQHIGFSMLALRLTDQQCDF